MDKIVVGMDRLPRHLVPTSRGASDHVSVSEQVRPVPNEWAQKGETQAVELEPGAVHHEIPGVPPDFDPALETASRRDPAAQIANELPHHLVDGVVEDACPANLLFLGGGGFARSGCQVAIGSRVTHHNGIASIQIGRDDEYGRRNG